MSAVIADLASRQHGVVSRWQLIDLGATPSMIKGWLAAGRLHPLHRAVYAVGHRAISREARWLAAVLACGAGAFLSHAPGGQLLGIVPRRERPALHVSLLDRADRRPRGIITHRPRGLDRRDTTGRLGIPVTTATRTVWDLASTLPRRPTRRAFEQAEKLGTLDRVRLSALLAASPSRRGAGVIRELLAERPLPLSETRSWLEDLALVTCREHGLPLPAVNVPLLGYEIDFLWESARFVVEADGSSHLDPCQRDRDNERDIALARAGYLVRRYSYLALDRENEVAAEIAAILAERLRAPVPPTGAPRR